MTNRIRICDGGKCSESAKDVESSSKDHVGFEFAREGKLRY